MATPYGDRVRPTRRIASRSDPITEPESTAVFDGLNGVRLPEYG